MSGFRTLKGLCIAATGLLAFTSSPAQAVSPEAQAARTEIEGTFGFVPSFFGILPEAAQPAAWEALRDLEFNPNTAIPSKYKSLISIAVAAQIPCQYCLYIDTEGARINGATRGEISEALGMAANTRLWSTVLNGMQIDSDGFRADVAGILDFVGKASAPAASGPVTDAASAYRDMEATLGRVPGFLGAYPKVGIAGAWKEFKALQLNPATEIPGKFKELIGLAVASQIPCTYCIVAHTEFAMAMGATSDEVAEAVAMAALTRHWSTLLNGSQQDPAAFRSEADRMLKFAMDSPRADK